MNNTKHDIIHGLPDRSEKSRLILRYILVFVGVGLLLAASILVFSNSIRSAEDTLYETSGSAIIQMIGCGVLAILIGGIQAWALQGKIPSEKTPFFILFAAIGGCIAGIISGVILNNNPIQAPLTFMDGFTTGVIAGSIAGGISSLLQIWLFERNEKSLYWILLNLISWTVFWGLSWGLSWIINGIWGYAVASVLVLSASGGTLSIYLNRVGIDF